MNLQTFRTREEYEGWKTRKLAAGIPSGRNSSSIINTIGTVFIIFACLALASALGTFVQAGTISTSAMAEVSAMFDELSEAQKDMPLLFRAAVFSLENIIPISLAQVLISVLMILSGVYFLKGRAWAGHAVEAFTWGIFLLVLCSGIAASCLWLDVLSRIEAQSASGPPPFVFTFGGIAVCASATLVFSAFPLLGIIKLRRRPGGKVPVLP
jgi:hypothetical protein